MSLGEPSTPADSTRTVAVCVPAVRPGGVDRHARSRGARAGAGRDRQPASRRRRGEVERPAAGVGDGERLGRRVRGARGAGERQRRGGDAQRRAAAAARPARRGRTPDSGPSLQTPPVDQVAGSVPSAAARAALLGAAGAARAVVPAQRAGPVGRVEQAEPVGLARLDAGRCRPSTLFQAPSCRVGDAAAEPSSAVGWPLLSANRPSTRCEAVDVAATYRLQLVSAVPELGRREAVDLGAAGPAPLMLHADHVGAAELQRGRALEGRGERGRGPATTVVWLRPPPSLQDENAYVRPPSVCGVSVPTALRRALDHVARERRRQRLGAERQSCPAGSTRQRDGDRLADRAGAWPCRTGRWRRVAVSSSSR